MLESQPWVHTCKAGTGWAGCWTRQRLVNDRGHRLGRGHSARGHACETAASSGAKRTHGITGLQQQPCEDQTQAFLQCTAFYERTES